MITRHTRSQVRGSRLEVLAMHYLLKTSPYKLAPASERKELV